jgi:hypothetical protein
MEGLEALPASPDGDLGADDAGDAEASVRPASAEQSARGGGGISLPPITTPRSRADQ